MSAPHVVVVGAGAFGGWTALHLRRRGARVTLVDAWGPGNARASSGGETRVIRATYGTRAIYTRLAARALALWEAEDARWRRGLLRKTGVLWLLTDGPRGAEAAAFGRASATALAAAGLPLDELSRADASRRFPQISFEGIAASFWEPEAGYLFARRACAHVVERFVADGGEYRETAVIAPLPVDGSMRRLPTTIGAIEADTFVFACGPWLPDVFPDVVGARIVATRQEVYYFGTPAGDARFTDPAMPAWIEYGDRMMYGIPGNANRGFKIADDTPGPRVDPTSMERHATPDGVEAARAFLRHRFPPLGDVPLVGAEVCQYEASPDAHFIIDRHPSSANVLIAGGGSGHGFKMGPAVGEMLAAIVLDGATPDPQFALVRFAAAPAGGWEEKWR